MTSNVVKIVEKKFLAPDSPSQDSSVSTSISYKGEYDPENTWYGLNAEVVVRDCIRAVTIEFGCHDYDSSLEAMRKINVFIDVLNNFRDNLADAQEIFLQHKDKADKEKSQHGKINYNKHAIEDLKE